MCDIRNVTHLSLRVYPHQILVVRFLLILDAEKNKPTNKIMTFALAINRQEEESQRERKWHTDLPSNYPTSYFIIIVSIL